MSDLLVTFKLRHIFCLALVGDLQELWEQLGDCDGVFFQLSFKDANQPLPYRIPHLT